VAAANTITAGGVWSVVVGSFSAWAGDDINGKGDDLDIGLAEGAILGVLYATAVKEFRLQKLAPNSRAVIGDNVSSLWEDDKVQPRIRAERVHPIRQEPLEATPGSMD